MQTHSGSPSRCRPWVLLLGPGARLARLPAHLGALPGALAEGRPESTRALEDLGQLFCDFPAHGRILLDSDALLLEEVGLLAGFLARHPGWQLALIGTDPGSGAARRLLASPRARWLTWPLDIDQLEQLTRFDAPPLEEELDAALDGAQLAGAGSAASGAADAREPAQRPAEVPVGRTSLAPELRAEIERILGRAPERGAPAAAVEAGPGSAGERPRAPAGARPQAARSGPAPLSAPAHLSAPGQDGPPPYFRAQVADLADIAQRLELATAMARERASAPGQATSSELGRSLEELDLETLRLAQFTRTLGYLVAPPPRGDQRIELAEMVEEHLAAVGREPGAPRYLFRSPGPLWVRADKALLAQALDAIVYLAHHCAGPEGSVRVEGRTRDGGAHAAVELALSFPAGPLEGTPPERALLPYALRRSLPELGANALAAARGIVSGQGGSLALTSAGEGQWRWELRLPGLDAATF